MPSDPTAIILPLDLCCQGVYTYLWRKYKIMDQPIALLIVVVILWAALEVGEIMKRRARLERMRKDADRALWIIDNEWRQG